MDEMNIIGFALPLSFQMHDDSERRAFLASSIIWVGISTAKTMVPSFGDDHGSMISQVAMAIFIWL